MIIDVETNEQIINYDIFLNKNTLIIGNRGSGKTACVLSMYDEMIKRNKFRKIYIICPTEQLNPNYSQHLPRAKIVFSLTDEVFNDLEKLPANSLIILDDCIPNKTHDIRKLKRLLSRDEHTNIVMLQFPYCDFADSFDNVLYGKDDMNSNMQLMYDYIKPFDYFDTIGKFKQYMEEMPQYNFMYFQQL